MRYNHLKLRKPYLIFFKFWKDKFSGKFLFSNSKVNYFLNGLLFEQLYGQEGKN